MKLSIVIPVFNNWNFTKDCLKDLSHLPYDHEVILVDNNSSDNTTNVLKEKDLPKNFSVIRNDVNRLFARACNQGYVAAKGEYVLFLNNDIRVQSNHEGWTSSLIQKAQEGAIVGPTGGLLNDKLAFVKETDELLEGNFYMSGWCLCAKKETFAKLVLKEYIGPFSEEFGLFYEDTDLGFRATNQNIKFIIEPVPVVHFGHVTSNKIGTSEYYLKAKAIFINKWKANDSRIDFKLEC